MKDKKIEQLSLDVHFFSKEVKDYAKAKFCNQEFNHHQGQLLMVLAENPDFNQAQLAKKLEITPATLSVRLKKLEDSGYVQRIENPDDKRNYQLVVSTKGLENIAAIKRSFKEMSKEIFSCLDDQEIDQLSKLINKCRNNIKDKKIC